MKTERGAALVEFIIVASVLLPIMFGVPMIGKMIDLKQTTVQASRYAAWETTVSVDGSAPQNLEERFFSDASAPIGSTGSGHNALWGVDDAQPSELNADVNTNGTAQVGMLSDYKADTAVVIASGARAEQSSAYRSLTVEGIEHSPAANESVAHVLGEAVDFLGELDDLTEGDWGMETDGLVRGVASVQMQGNGWLGPRTVTQGTVIMNDNWSVAEARAARDRIRPLVPANALHPLGDALGLIGKVPLIKELDHFGDHGVFGYIDVEPLPDSENVGPRPLKPYSED